MLVNSGHLYPHIIIMENYVCGLCGVSGYATERLLHGFGRQY